MYILDGLIDKEITSSSLESMKVNLDSKKLGEAGLTCNVCGKSFKTKTGLAIHISKGHDKTENSESQLMNVNVSSNDVSKKQNNSACGHGPSPCDICMNIKDHDMKSHGLSCQCCDFRAKGEDTLRRHERDVHGTSFASLSPKQKKLKKSQDDVEDMESSEVIDLDSDVEMSDEHVIKRDEVEESFSKQAKEPLEAVTLNAKENKQQEHGEEIDLVSKPYLKQLPEAVKVLVGDDHYLFPIEGDGACGPRTFAAWIFQDPTLGPYLARNINSNFVQYWDQYWREIFSFPFTREVGNGNSITCESEKDLLNFFSTSNDGAYMWRGHEDFAVISNTYQLKIKIITIQSDDDDMPSVTVIEPNPKFEKCSEVQAGKIPDMTVLHHFNSHYSLIVPSNCWLAQNGGLDYQRKLSENKKNKESSIIDNPSNVVEDRLTLLEKKIDCLQKRCQSLEEKNEKLESRLKEVISSHNNVTTVQSTSDEVVESNP